MRVLVSIWTPDQAIRPANHSVASPSILATAYRTAHHWVAAQVTRLHGAVPMRAERKSIMTTSPIVIPAGPERSVADLQSRRDHALALLLTHRGNPLTEIDHLLADDPQGVSGHCLRAAAIVHADATAARPRLATSLAVIEAACPDADDPARRHADAARAWLDGDPALAAERYGAIILDRPHDVLTLATAHALDFRLGQQSMLRNRLAQALPAWNATMSGYASVLAMYAFGLEENGEYRRAEELARRALAIDPRHPGAIHVLAHVMEMEGRAREGLALLDKTEEAWIEGTGFSVHLAWHRALFQIEADNPASALATYDAQIAATRIAGMPALADGSALLWRLKLRNIPVGKRWRELADRWERQSLAGVRPFFIIHAVIAFAAAGRTTAAGAARSTAAHRQERRCGTAPGGGARGAVLRSASRLRGRRLCGVRRMAKACARRRAPLRRQPRAVRHRPSHLYRGGLARPQAASRRHTRGGASSAKADQPAQREAAGAPAHDRHPDAINSLIMEHIEEVLARRRRRAA